MSTSCISPPPLSHNFLHLFWTLVIHFLYLHPLSPLPLTISSPYLPSLSLSLSDRSHPLSLFTYFIFLYLISLTHHVFSLYLISSPSSTFVLFPTPSCHLLPLITIYLYIISLTLSLFPHSLFLPNCTLLTLSPPSSHNIIPIFTLYMYLTSVILFRSHISLSATNLCLC